MRAVAQTLPAAHIDTGPQHPTAPHSLRASPHHASALAPAHLLQPLLLLLHLAAHVCQLSSPAVGQLSHLQQLRLQLQGALGSSLLRLQLLRQLHVAILELQSLQEGRRCVVLSCVVLCVVLRGVVRVCGKEEVGMCGAEGVSTGVV
jgi:hypothetical protein